MSPKPLATTTLLTETQRTMLKKLLTLSPGAPASIYGGGVGWLIEREYHRLVETVPPAAREGLGLVLEPE